jgi:hypothetical protein
MPLGGKDTVFSHATNGSPSSNNSYTAKMRSLSIAFDGEEVDATVFGDGFREYEQSFKSATINATYKMDAAIWTVLTDLYTNGTEITFEIGPLNSDAPNPKITGSMVMISFTEGLDIGTLQEIPVVFRMTGAPTFGVYT